MLLEERSIFLSVLFFIKALAIATVFAVPMLFLYYSYRILIKKIANKYIDILLCII